jgi:pyruvate formate lyase activating enzyme
MKIGGFKKQSLIDWEDRLVAVVFTRGCNFRCSYCHNQELVYPRLYKDENSVGEEYIIDYLATRREWLDGVVISGGEPTEQPDLLNFVGNIKSLGFQVKIDTNGSNPSVLRELISKKLIDFVAMDIKTILNPASYMMITGIHDGDIVKKVKLSLEILIQSDISFQLRTTRVEEFHSAGTITTLQKQFGNYNYVLNEYRDPVKF